LNNKAANTVRHDIWRTIMQAANKKYPGGEFDAPPAGMTGTTMISIPQVAGTAPEAAVELIKASDLNAKVATSPVTSSFPKGSVAYTRPGVGTTAARGSQIKIFVSAGGAETVPNVAGMSVTNAKATLLAAGFSAVSEPQPSQGQFFVKSPTIPAGKVVGTDPAAGSPADKAGAILLIISTGP
jgi:beta-lactam-binding protein with PASTA domain